MTDRLRLDQYLSRHKDVASRNRAHQLIADRAVRVNGVTARKASLLIKSSDFVELDLGDDFVSRGAIKLIAALDAFEFDVDGLVCLDIGASTGGFTEVLLRRNARKVYAVDVGTGQLHPRIASDARVVNLEQTHAKKLSRKNVEDAIDLVVCDVSFISCRKILDYGLALAASTALLISLIKPQFELGVKNIGKGGIVKATPAEIDALIEKMKAWVVARDWQVTGIMESPIRGGDGNREYLIAASRQS